MADMTFEKVNMSSLFKGSRNLAIPSYQRGYAWTNQEWEDFWDDLTEVIKENEDDHFFGQVVTNLLDNTEYIVDGQQRITTSIIFLAVLRDNFKDINSSTAQIRAEDIQIDFIGKRGSYTFKQTDKVAAFFNHLIQNPGYSFEEVQGEAGQESEKNFVKAYKYLNDKITSTVKSFLTPEDRVNYLELVRKAFLDHMFVMKISTADEASAFVIFETLNARGRDLNSSDLLKNYLFRKAVGDETIQEKWDDMMEPLGFDSNKATKFIRSYWNGTNDFVTEKKLYRALSRKIQTKAAAIQLVNDLERFSDDFAALLNPSNQDSFSNEVLIRNLSILKLLGAKTFYPLALIMVKRNISESEIAQVLHKIISFTVRNFTVGHLVANKYEKTFAIIARDLNDGKINTVDEINKRISEQMVNDGKFSEDLKALTVSTEKVSKYLLSELDYENDSQKIELGSVKAVYINENIDNKDRLGNRLLITKEEAKKFKASSSNKAKIINQSKFTETEKWATKVNNITSEEVDDRQSAWVNLAINIWSK